MFWVLAIVLFFLYLDASYIYLDDSALFKLRIYMYMVIFIGIIGIWMFLDIEAAAWDTETASIRQTERAGRTVAAGKSESAGRKISGNVKEPEGCT